MFDSNVNKVAALDYGEKRIGYALSDSTYLIATSKDTFVEKSLKYIKEVLVKDNVKIIVVGMPSIKDGKVTKIIEKINLFCENLKLNDQFIVINVDESYSSQRAAELMLENGTKKNKRKEKGSLDKIAASIILQDFLDSQDFANNYKKLL